MSGQKNMGETATVIRLHLMKVATSTSNRKPTTRNASAGVTKILVARKAIGRLRYKDGEWRRKVTSITTKSKTRKNPGDVKSPLQRRRAKRRQDAGGTK